MTPTNQMTPSLRERIDKEFDDYGPYGFKRGKLVYQLLLAIKEALPEKHINMDWNMGDMQQNYRSSGWNAAIEEMERRLGLGTESTNKKP